MTRDDYTRMLRMDLELDDCYWLTEEYGELALVKKGRVRVITATWYDGPILGVK